LRYIFLFSGSPNGLDYSVEWLKCRRISNCKECGREQTWCS